MAYWDNSMDQEDSDEAFLASGERYSTGRFPQTSPEGGETAAQTGGGGTGGGGFDFGSIMGALGSAVTQSMMTAPEVPKGMQDLYAQREKNRQQLEEEERGRQDLLDRYNKNIDVFEKDMQQRFLDQARADVDFITKLPTGVGHVEDMAARQDRDLDAAFRASSARYSGGQYPQ